MIEKIFYEEKDIIKEKYLLKTLKDGKDCSVHRIEYQDKTYIAKIFHTENTREIQCYNLLQRMGVPTLNIFDTQRNILIIEDLDCSQTHRLARPEDMDLPGTGQQLARWYNLFHEAGFEYYRDYKDRGFLNMDLEILSLEKIMGAVKKLGLADNKAIERVLGMVPLFISAIKKQRFSFVYNDFFYGNVALPCDEDGTAIVFDYNFMVKGMAGSDYRNVTYGLGEEARETFTQNYKFYRETEIILDRVVSKLVGIVVLAEMGKLPEWGKIVLKEVNDKKFLEAVESGLLTMRRELRE